MNAVEPVLLFIGTELVVCLRIECPCQDAVSQQKKRELSDGPAATSRASAGTASTGEAGSK